MGDLVRRDDDGFGVPEQSGGLITGAMLKFNDRVYLVDKTEELPLGTRLVALNVTTTWIHWQDGKPEHHITELGRAHPCREDWPDQDKSKWPLDQTGNPSDPWKDTRYVHLVDPRNGKDYTFITDTIGGRRAVGDLKNQTRNVRLAHPGAVPVVELRWTMMKTRHGLKPRPLFEVVDWRCGGRSGEPAPQMIDGPDNNKKGAIEHRKAEFEDEIPFE
jgi:hypothetical protein